MSCSHEWRPYQAEGLTWNARCRTCGELALRDQLERMSFAEAQQLAAEAGQDEVPEPPLAAMEREADRAEEGAAAKSAELAEAENETTAAENGLYRGDKMGPNEEEENALYRGDKMGVNDLMETFDGHLVEIGDIEHEEQAERYLEWLRYRMGKIDEISQRMDAEIERLEARKKQLVSGHRQRAEYLEQALKKHLWESGEKRIDYAYGSLSRRKGREKVEVRDETAFCFKHGDQQGLVATTRRPDKVGIKAHIKKTGEIPDGADLVRGDDTCTITLTEGAAP